MTRRMTAPAFQAKKGESKLVCVTAYDAPTAALVDEAGVDLILVGDSLGNVLLGYETTLPVTLEDMISHSAAVVRSRPRALVVADLPYLTYHVSPEETVRNAGRLVQEAGVDAVKLEGGASRVPHIAALLQARIPVMGHLGLTPQSVLEFGGYRVQGRSDTAAEVLLADAHALADTGCFSLVLEGIPAPLGEHITREVPIPTIGIGAGPKCDGQILVINDLLGITERAPKFVRRYADLRGVIRQAVGKYERTFGIGTFPGPDETYSG